jgi:hypothetical protein
MRQHPPNHDVGRVMAFCTLSMHIKGRLSINIVVLVLKLLLVGENFLICEKDIFMPLLRGPQEETFCSCQTNFLQSRSKEVFL